MYYRVEIYCITYSAIWSFSAIWFSIYSAFSSIIRPSGFLFIRPSGFCAAKRKGKRSNLSSHYYNYNHDGGLGDIQWIEMSRSQYPFDELDLVTWLKLYYQQNFNDRHNDLHSSWYGRPNPEDRINRKPKDRIFDRRTE